MTRKKSHHHKKHTAQKKCASSDKKKCRSSSSVKKCHCDKPCKARPKVNVFQSAATVEGTGQFIPPGTAGIKVNFDVAKFDTANAFSLTTERFQPRTAGYYSVNATVGLRPNGSTHNIYTFIRKNGGENMAETFSIDDISQQQPRMLITTTTSTLIYMDGRNDYLEVYMQHNCLDSILIIGGQAITFFTANLVK